MRWAVGLAAGYAIYAIALGLVAPRLAREPLADALGEWLGVDVAVDRVTANPFNLRFELSGIELRDERGELLVSADALVANVELLQSLVGVPRISEIRLESPTVRARLSEGGDLNLLALLPDDESDATDEPDDGSGLFPLRIDAIRLGNGSIRVMDRSQKRLFIANLAPIDLVIERISTVPDESGRVRLDARGSRGLHLVTEFDARIAPPSARGELRLEGLRHTMIGDYLGPEFAVRPTAGELDVDADFLIELDEAEGLVLRIDSGRVEARGWQADSDLAEVARIGLERVAVEGFRLGLAEKEVSVTRVVLEAPHVEAVLPDAAQARAAPPPTAEVPAAVGAAPDPGAPPVGAGWTARLGTLSVERGQIGLAAAAAREDPIVRMGPIDLEARGLTTTPGEEAEVELKLALPDDDPVGADPARSASDGARIELAGRVVPRPFAAELDVDAIAVALAPWSSLVGFAPGTRITDGRLDVTSSIEARTAEGSDVPEVAASTNATLRGLVIEQPTGSRGKPRPVVRIGRLLLDRMRVRDTASRIDVASVRVDSPAIYLARDERGQLNLMRLLAPAPETARPADGPGLLVDVRRVEVADGRLDYRDVSTNRPFNLDITGLEGQYERRTSATGAAGGSIAFEGRVHDSAPLRVTGGFPAPDAVDVDVELAGLQVLTLAPYFEQYVGSEVEQGKLHLDLAYTLRGRQLRGENLLRFDRLVFGRRTGSPDALNLPVPLAFRLMRDTKGQVEFPLPIQGNVDDPDFSLRRLVTAAFVKAIQQSLTSPLAVLQTAMPDLTADKRTALDFAPGSATLETAQLAKLTDVATVVASQKGQRVALKGRVDARLDGKALRNAGEEDDEEHLRALAKGRARAIARELVDGLGLATDRVFLRSVDLEGKAVDGRVPVDVILTDD